ncbi:MAG: hypothetical protein J0L55_00810 [Caulobacterales bacterium]|nr:hypothetical protein [Caulobacterales bacterium]MCA0372294.1 hypothetical protein [Pseudomonadota bacterium]
MKLWAFAGLLFLTQVSSPCFCEPIKSTELIYNVTEGTTQNQFIRDKNTSAHIILRSGAKLRALVAFPAGNSGVSIWFKPQANSINWKIIDTAKPISQKDDKGRDLYGVEFIASINTKQLEIENTILSSIRTIRDYEYKNPILNEIYTKPQIANNIIIYKRERLDGDCSYFLYMEIIDGKISDNSIISNNGNIKIKFRALSGEKPLTPLYGGKLLQSNLSHNDKSIKTLTFLSYKEKFLAGSWRFNTYFGRDTLLSIKLMMPILSQNAIETGLQSVLSRLNDSGEVAHEEAIGEYAIIENFKNSPQINSTPYFDYSMIDGNYLLPIITRDYLLNNNIKLENAAMFLANKNEKGQTNGSSLVSNLVYIINQSQKFAYEPKYQNLIALKNGKKAGQWRDSDFGLGGGIYPYDVNAIFVPNALNAIADLYKSGLLNPYINQANEKDFGNIKFIQKSWRENAAKLFEVNIDKKSANNFAIQYAKELSIKANENYTKNIVFHAISLDTNGNPINILNSDEGFELLFDQPNDLTIQTAIAPLLHKFPFGLITDAGMVVANPVFADEKTKAGFNKNQYHGTVIWSWQQTLMAQGIAKQLTRKDISTKTRSQLLMAQDNLLHVIKNSKSLQNSELWTWDYKNGKFQIAHFGQNNGDVDETNAAQLWSSSSLLYDLKQ